MIDRGWRRSGRYCYAPDLRRSCCPQYTIKLDALKFQPGRSHRKITNRWNRFILSGGQETSSSASFSLVSSLHSSEEGFIPTGKAAIHRFEVILEPSSFTEEKYQLYTQYQEEIHHDSNNTPNSFKRFLVDTPLSRDPITYVDSPSAHLPREYGSYHQLYRLDGELIAMGVIDVLPSCVSSVYFMYNPAYERFSLGKLSALREIALALEIHDAGCTSVQYLYMGFYIHSCQKMRYKGEYAPSYLADPEDFTWHPLKECQAILDGHRYGAFTNPEHSLKGEGDPGEETGVPIPTELLENISILKAVRQCTIHVVPFKETMAWEDEDRRRDAEDCFGTLGSEVAQEILFYFTM